MRKVLDGNIEEDARAQLEALLSRGDITAYKVCKETGINNNTLRRFRNGEKITVQQLDILGSWIRTKGY